MKSQLRATGPISQMFLLLGVVWMTMPAASGRQGSCV